ncbi:MAG: RnfABCDGE type electron transport complex subunit B [Bacteroidales bacterium]|nr:RnfABCDGE type electron transport complex subunit B [Bacteroidales bacterium]MDY0216123.1 RnfABCDGE type electron transport complex subunit B [Bacteroidales bacterium]
MITLILYSLLALSLIGLISAIVLYFVSQKFKVIEDPKIDEIAELLPSANCGGCGFAGCRAFAEAIVRQGNLDNIHCPVGGNSLVKLIAPVLGIVAEENEPQVAVIRCNGSKENAPSKAIYDSIQTCAFSHALFAGESGCPNGCLGCGDCVVSCMFDAMYMDKETGLPVIIAENCVACGACVKACPRSIIELRHKGKKDRRIYVDCINKEKGAVALKNCKVACIGCGKCVKVCPFDAITLVNNLAYIDDEKCKLCRKCAPVCPTGAIIEIGFPARKENVETTTNEEKA